MPENIAQRLADSLIKYNSGSIALEQVVAELVAAVAELDARTAREAADTVERFATVASTLGKHNDTFKAIISILELPHHAPQSQQEPPGTRIAPDGEVQED